MLLNAGTYAKVFDAQIIIFKMSIKLICTVLKTNILFGSAIFALMFKRLM